MTITVSSQRKSFRRLDGEVILDTDRPTRAIGLKLRRESFGGMICTPPTIPTRGKPPIQPLNKAHTRILELCDGNHTAPEIGYRLASEFDLDPATTLAKTEKILKEYLLEGLICHTGKPEIFSNVVDLDDPWVHPKPSLMLTAPILVTIYFTHRCNLRCLHCNAEASIFGTEDELSLEEWKSVMDALSELNVFRVVVTGGEPLQRDGFFELSRHITSRGMSVELNTNGTLITPSVAQMLWDSGVRKVSVSLDGAKQESHEILRGKNQSFARAISGIENCLRAGMLLFLNFTVTRLNYAEIPEFFQLARNLGVHGVKFFYLFNMGRTTENQWLLPTEEQLLIADQAIIAGANEDGILLSDGWIGVTSGETGFTQPCGAAVNRCAITVNGTVLPCVFFHKSTARAGEQAVKSDNIRFRKFKDIWQKSDSLCAVRSSKASSPKCALCKPTNSM